ncbi:hypothetical protein Rs2_10319 [Raphanus sativus]|uniref:Late embryogenesis abundant protein M17-like n=1 Tax=Raphanus sativus TaxID=3726 RepID=A0A6J0MSM3_RAPSA|nr:late embryogenesis abundant protein M17-like [Raphanus sativus]KAJ4906661.1 hypothetical protein Rs2_10319 [Raphanus sativus]
MGSLKSLTLLALLLSFSLGVFAETSNDAATHANDEVKPSEATDAIEPQQRGGCRYGCCGAYAFGRCSACCSRPKAVEAMDTKAVEVIDVEPQQRGRGGCRYGCCGSYAFGRCSACCSLSQAQAVVEAVEGVEPQQRGRGGCRYGCCGSYAFGRCSACCSLSQAQAVVEAEVEPQQRSRCRYGCCGSYAYGQCSACCSKKTTQEEAKP